MGEPGSPAPPPAGGFGRAQPSQEEPFLIPSVCGAAAWTANVKITPWRGVWGNRVPPRPRPAGIWGNRVSPFPHPRESGRAKPSSMGLGKPGFPTPPPAGGSGKAKPSSIGLGKPGFPTPLPAGGPGPQAGGGGNLVSPSPHPVRGFGRDAPSKAPPHPRITHPQRGGPHAMPGTSAGYVADQG